jgi:hypothetical protein
MDPILSYFTSSDVRTLSPKSHLIIFRVAARMLLCNYELHGHTKAYLFSVRQYYYGAFGVKNRLCCLVGCYLQRRFPLLFSHSHFSSVGWH